MTEAYASPPPRRSGTLYWLPLILDCEDLDPTETLLLIALADHVDADDACWVGIDRLARAARVSYGTARRRLAELEARGILTRSRRRRESGNLSVYTYTLRREAIDPLARESRASQRAPECAVASAHLDARAEPPSDEPPREELFTDTCARTREEPQQAPGSSSPLGEEPAFAEFWQAYPNKRGKDAARKAFTRARARCAGDARPIIVGAGRYRDDPNRVDQFTKHPSTWLNGGCWEDPPLPARGPARTGGRQDRQRGWDQLSELMAVVREHEEVYG